MTHNLPEHIREHFSEANRKHLEGVVELCPAYRHIKEEGVIIYDLIAYGFESNSCMDCKGEDRTCQVYMDYLKSRGLV